MNGVETERLYYRDAYLRRFTARALARQSLNGRPAIALDRTAFYPTGGGQPNDTGTLGGVEVVDVTIQNGLVWHAFKEDVPAESFGDDTLDGVVDWARRFDHMQQHTGQHILSQAFIRTYDAETVAFHLGSSESTIDLGRTDLSHDDVSAAEAAANAIIDAALPVTAAFVDQADLGQLPLRKPPKVTGQIRIVQVEGYDWSACGGTHVASTAEVGLLKIVRTERRGSELRISFLGGARARADYARLQTLVAGLAARFTVGQDELPAAVDRLLAEQRDMRRELGDMEAQWVESTADLLWGRASVHGPWRVVATLLDCPVERAKRVAQALRVRPDAVILLAARGEKPQLVFTRADDVSVNVGDLLRTAAAAGGGRGGGRPDWAQGGVPTDEALRRALDAAEAALGRA